jgi:hypothetical protein
MANGGQNGANGGVPSTSTVNAAKFVKYGRIIESYMRYREIRSLSCCNIVFWSIALLFLGFWFGFLWLSVRTSFFNVQSEMLKKSICP